MRRALSILALLIAAYALAFLTFPGPASGGLARALFATSITAIALLSGLLLGELTRSTEVQP